MQSFARIAPLCVRRSALQRAVRPAAPELFRLLSLGQPQYRYFAAEKQEAEEPKEKAEGEEVAEEETAADVAAKAAEKAAKEAAAKIKELQDKLMYSYAEAENLRQRTRREVDNANKYAVSKFAKELLDVADNLERAADAVTPQQLESNAELKALHEGVDMTKSILHKTFGHYDITKFDSLGQSFDPNLHEAMFEVPGQDGQEPGSVAHVMNEGYMIKDRVLRPARVGTVKKA
mmetsp:Transcript_30970/g.67997  ORF Transcript_30970/g.67997 Transcript_30970/m.67997 type:complete len:233 (-) Transcript_30970:492-1190(-)